MSIYTRLGLREIIIRGELSFYSAFLVMIVTPLSFHYLPPFIGLWGVCWLIELKNKINSFPQIKGSYKLLYLLFLLFFIWQLLGMIYTDDTSNGWRNIVIRLSVFAFPLFLVIPGEMLKKRATLLLRIFALSTFLYIIICFGNALENSIKIIDGTLIFNPHPEIEYWWNYFYGSLFAIKQHTSYLSAMVLLAILISADAVYDSSITKYCRLFWILAAIVLLISLYLLSSRIAILTALLIIPLYLLLKSLKRGKNRYSWILIIMAVIVLFPYVLKNPRVSHYLRWNSRSELKEAAAEDGRIIIWKSAFNIIQDHWILGVGTGDSQKELNKQYDLAGKTKLSEGKFNVHNQYLEVLLENGLVGLCLFISIIAMMVNIGFSEKNLIYLMFILIILLFFFSETILNRVAGAVFFSLFSFLLLYNDSKNSKIETEM
jgi:O-antigen ligase